MSHIQNNLTLVCYDISSDVLRRKIDKTLKDFGQRIQFSIFLCRLDGVAFERMRDKLNKLLNKHNKYKSEGDSVIIFKRFAYENMDCLVGQEFNKAPPSFKIL